MNVSSRKLTLFEINLLNKGLSFVPKPFKIRKDFILADFNELARKLRLKFLFRDSQREKSRFKRITGYNPGETEYNTLENFINSVREQICIQRKNEKDTQTDTEYKTEIANIVRHSTNTVSHVPSSPQLNLDNEDNGCAESQISIGEEKRRMAQILGHINHSRHPAGKSSIYSYWHTRPSLFARPGGSEGEAGWHMFRQQAAASQSTDWSKLNSTLYAVTFLAQQGGKVRSCAYSKRIARWRRNSSRWAGSVRTCTTRHLTETRRQRL